ncbi:hypothetical protein HanPSC8_Chr05g0205221 [Helianthus annuus]|nr:hypothetical protein HanPSC8_Chr05g0205221 [Helianthus annuus]
MFFSACSEGVGSTDNSCCKCRKNKDKNSKFWESSSSGHNWVEVAAKREGILAGRKRTTISDTTKGGHKVREGR